MLRKSNAIRLLSAGLLLAAAGLWSGAALAADSITVGVTRLASQAPVFIAQDRGYFEEEGITAELSFFESAQPVAVGIASGDVDYGITAITGGLVNLAEKDAVRVIGGCLVEEPGVDGNMILVSRKAFDEGVTSAEKLEGRSFGITQAGSSFHYMIAKIAEGAGFDMSTMRLVPLQKVGAVSAALTSGQIDSWTIQPNIGKTLAATDEVEAIGMVSEYLPNYQVTAVFTSVDNIENNRDLTERFLRAFSKGAADHNAALVEKSADEAEIRAVTEIIAKYAYPGQPYEKASEAIQAGAMKIAENARLNVESVEDQLEWMKSEELIPATASMEKLVDTSFVETN